MNKRKLNKSMLTLAALAVIGTSAGYATIANAQAPTAYNGTVKERGMIGPHLLGTIKTINGTTFTLTGKNGVTYTVNASSTSVVKTSKGSGPVVAKLTDLKAGDVVVVEGIITGTNIVATEIMFGGPSKGIMGFMKNHRKGDKIRERSQHGVQGTVTSINGNILTITKADGTVYTINATTTPISKITSITIGDIRLGDTIGVYGKVTGTNITASHIIDGQLPIKEKWNKEDNDN